jgi:hypothetical protein
VVGERILVDTSAWIASFKKTGHPDLKELLRVAIVSGRAAICPLIILELLQGCRAEGERDSLRTQLESLDPLSVTPPIWERAYGLGFSLRTKGLNVPVVTVVIAAVALEHDVLLLHEDRHYELMVYPRDEASNQVLRFASDIQRDSA